MQPEHVLTYLFFYFTLAAIVVVVASVSKGCTMGGTLTATTAILSLIGLVALASVLQPGRNSLTYVSLQIVQLSRVHLVSALLGVASAIPFSLLLLREKYSRARHFIVFAGLLGTLLAGGLLSAKDHLSSLIPHPQGELEVGVLNRSTDEGFVLENVTDTEITPIRVAVSQTGRIFVSGQVGIAAQSGAISELVEDATGQYRERIVARMLNRPYGLAARDDSIYVSRSGQYTKWTNGKAKHFATGAVTLLRDLSGDGELDYYHDLVSDLPGARAPDYLHQNNAIAFGEDGTLYITSGISSDGHPPRHPWEGTILKASPPDYKQVEVFATGLRNTFGLVIGPDGQLFATDNDAQSGTLANAGDKLVHVREGANFGHPYADQNDPQIDAPLYVSQFAMAGMTYTDSTMLPEKYRGCLYVVSYGEGRILRFEVTKVGNSYQLEPFPFAVVPGAVDISAAPNGDFYVVVYPDRVVRIRYAGS